MIPAARVSDSKTCQHGLGQISPPGAKKVLIGGMPPARLADFTTCPVAPDVIVKGASTVLIEGLPAARAGDATVHGGLVTWGEDTVRIGDPAFELPSNFQIGGSATFQNKIIRDLYFLSTIPSGKELIRRLEGSEQTIGFVPTSDQNGYTYAGEASILGPAGSVIAYNPDHRSNYHDSAGNLCAQPPQVILAHEMCHALEYAEGTSHDRVDPSPPASEPKIPESEAKAIGTGSHEGRSPSENSILKDLGMPRRDNHWGSLGPAPGEPAPVELRPGGP